MFFLLYLEYPLILRLTGDLKTLDESYRIILGGPEVSYTTAEILGRNPQIDYILCGEGEQTLQLLLSRLNHGEVVVAERSDEHDGHWNGIASSVHPHAAYVIAERLNEIPSPYTDEMLARIGGRIVYYESTRGCPFSCSYCISSTFDGVRYFPESRIRADLERLVSAGTPVIKFVDRTFNCNKRHMLSVFSILTELMRGLLIKPVVHFEVSPGLFDEEIFAAIEHLCGAICVQFEIGLQSLHQATLDEIKRPGDLPTAIRNIQRLLRIPNLHIHLDLIAGLPFEDLKTFMRTFDMVFHLYPQQLQCGFLKLLKGSLLREEADKHRYRYLKHAPYEVLSNQYLNFGEICVIKKVAFLVDKLYNSARFHLTIRYFTKHLYQSPFAFFLALSADARLAQGNSMDSNIAGSTDNGNLGGMRSTFRAGLFYEILADFADRFDDSAADVVKCLLCFDYFCAGGRGAFPDALSDIVF